MTLVQTAPNATDGYVSSNNAAYATARTQAVGSTVDTGNNVMYWGQNNNGGTYACMECMFGFTLPAFDESLNLLTTAQLRITTGVMLATGVARDFQLRSYDWTAGGLTTADWRNATAMGSDAIVGKVQNIHNNTSGLQMYVGSDEMRNLVEVGTALSLYGTSSRLAAGTTPTSDEGAALWSNEAGAGFAPSLSYVYAPRHFLTHIAGAEAQLSDGTWVYLARTTFSGSTLNLRHMTKSGTETTIASFTMGTASTEFFAAPGTQAIALTVDSSDHIYMVGRAGNAENSLLARAFVKGAGYTWTGSTAMAIPLPTHDSGINNVAAAWHPTANGTIVVLAAHTAGTAISGASTNDVAYALLDSTVLRAGSGTVSRATGSAVDAGLVFAGTNSSWFNTTTNDTGNGLDVVADWTQTDYGYAICHKRNLALGGYDGLPMGRYILNASGNGFSHVSLSSGTTVWSTKDATAKLRVLNVGSGLVALITADKDSGWGITVSIYQVSGSTAGGTNLGRETLDGQTPHMVASATVANSEAWDAVYNAAENSIWVYYVSSADNTIIERTSVDLNTYQATQKVVQVYDAINPVLAIRTPRNAVVTTVGAFSMTGVTGGSGGFVHVVDVFNIAPYAPTLTPKTNYDATLAATFAWTFADPNTGDTQSAYQLQIDRVSDGVNIVDSGKVASTTSSRNVTGGTLTNGVDYRWRVRTYDAADVVGPWSDYGTFSTASGGTVTVTAPATDNPAGVITDDYPVTWSVSGTVQASYHVWVTRNDTSATVYDSGWVTSTATSQAITGMVTDVEHTIHVQVRNASAVDSGIGTRLITPSFSHPEAPVISVTTFPDLGYTLISVNNPIPTGDKPDVSSNDILRRRAGTMDLWDVIGQCGPDGEFRDYTAPARIPVEYIARGNV